MRRLIVPAMILAVVLLIFAALVVVRTVGDNQEGVDQAQLDANIARALTEQTVQSRANGVILACQEINERHGAVTTTLNKLRAEALAKAKTQAERQQIMENQRPTRLFINALVPKRDCEKRARELVPEAY